jgi:hypothetical protein
VPIPEAVPQSEKEESKNQLEIYPMGHCLIGLMPHGWWYWSQEDGNPVMLDPIRYMQYMAGAKYLANRDATNRAPSEDDKWTGIHLPLYAEIWHLHAKKDMSRSSRVTQAMDLRCHGGQYSKFFKHPAMAKIYSHCPLCYAANSQQHVSWSVATRRQMKDEEHGARGAGSTSNIPCRRCG